MAGRGLYVEAAGIYDGDLRAAVLALKRGERAYLLPLARLIAARASAIVCATGVPPIVPCPGITCRGFAYARATLVAVAA